MSITLHNSMQIGKNFILYDALRAGKSKEVLMEPIYDVVIIGGGPAGYTAALYACRAGLDTVVVERMAAGGQMALTDWIDNYPGFEEGIEGFTLGMKMQKGAERFGAKTMYGEVISVDFTGNTKHINMKKGVLMGRTVVIAAGADPRELGLPGEKELIGRGLHYCAHCDGRFYEGKEVAVIGGGNSAVEDALYLSRIVSRVHLIHRRDSLRAAKIYQESLLKMSNVIFHWNYAVSEILTEAQRVIGVKVQHTKTGDECEICCEAVFVSIGRKPATGFLNKQVELDQGGYVIAGESTATNIPGVFAAGDIRTKALRQVVTAVADGAAAMQAAEEYLVSQNR